MDRKEFNRQLKGQERGINSQTIAENKANRENYQRRKDETGDGRAPEADVAQRRAKEKAFQSRISTNMEKKNMSYGEAKKEAEEWMNGQAALHNPDQVAGGDPNKVSRMGNSRVNSSIGSQWSKKVKELESGINAYIKNFNEEDLGKIKMNFKLVLR